MSLKVMHLVFEADHVRDLSEFAILLALADEADDEGKAFPGRERLARKSRLKPRSTNEVTKRLEQKGALVVIERGGPIEYNRPNLYVLSLDWLRNGPVGGGGGGVENPEHPAPDAGCHPEPGNRVRPEHPASDYQYPAPDAGKLQSNAPNPIHTTTTSKNSSSKPRARESAVVDNLLPAGIGGVEALLQRGVDEPVARRLVEERSAATIEGLVLRFDAERAAGEERTPGWLVKAITEGWSAKPSVAARENGKLLSYAEACDAVTRSGLPWDEVLEAVDVDGRTMWRALR